LNICELCGTSNGELDTECRVCGHSLAAAETQQPQTVTAQPAPAQMQTENPTHGESMNHPAAEGQRQLQISSVREQAPTGAPPMLSNESRQESMEQESLPGSSLPGFMQEGGRGHFGGQEQVELISANDLPVWIRQIAEADAAKAQAEAEQAQPAPTGEAPTSLVKRALPGETRASGPPTSWLSKTAAPAESAEHWASEEAAAANWGTPESGTVHSGQPAYPTVNPGTAYVPSVQAQPAATDKPRRFSRPQTSNAPGTPIYRSRTVQLAALILLLVLLAAVLI
jgi:hypothetical protein